MVKGNKENESGTNYDVCLLINHRFAMKSLIENIFLTAD
jgi:hypothetical protein